MLVINDLSTIYLPIAIFGLKKVKLLPVTVDNPSKSPFFPSPGCDINED
jgi:hypothetical protein